MSLANSLTLSHNGSVVSSNVMIPTVKVLSSLADLLPPAPQAAKATVEATANPVIPRIFLNFITNSL